MEIIIGDVIFKNWLKEGKCLYREVFTSFALPLNSGYLGCIECWQDYNQESLIRLSIDVFNFKALIAPLIVKTNNQYQNVQLVDDLLLKLQKNSSLL